MGGFWGCRGCHHCRHQSPTPRNVHRPSPPSPHPFWPVCAGHCRGWPPSVHSGVQRICTPVPPAVQSLSDAQHPYNNTIMYQSLSKGLSIPTFNSNVSISEYRITILLAEQVYQYIIIMSQENVSVAKAMLTLH